MHITLVDDSIAFDGYSASSRPLGGAEKAFASLPRALARRGHTVAVFNRCRWSMFIEGAQWETFDGKKPLPAEWSAKGLAVGLLPPAVRFEFLADKVVEPSTPPRAVVTTHPLHGLSWLVDLWVSNIHPRVPGAELHVYSMGPAKAAEGGELDPGATP